MDLDSRSFSRPLRCSALALLANAPLPPAEPTSPKIEPMTYVQAGFFETRLIPYGKHGELHRTVAETMEEDLSYLPWLADQKDDFKEDLKRYLASERSKARMARRAI